MAARTDAGHGSIRDHDWGPVPLVVLAAALASALVSLAQRDALVPPGVDVLLALVAVAPWLTERLTGWFPPRPLFGVVVIAGVAALLATEPAQFDFAPFLLVLMAAEVGATAAPWTAAALALLAGATMVGIDVADRFSGSGLWVSGVLAGFAFGQFMQAQLRLVAQARAAQRTLAEKAAVEERRRIAREVHDVVAHSLSVTMLHLTAARHSLERGGDVDDAVEALREAERAGRQSLADIRRTVGLLSPATSTASAPEPSAADIGDLVSRLAGAGLPVTYEVTGDPATVPLTTGLGLYRIAQESLSNAARHAPGAPVLVRLEVGDDRLGLEVRNELARPGAAPLDGTGGGLGLEGMEERAALLGGSLFAGPDGDGWVVRLEVPRPVRAP